MLPTKNDVLSLYSPYSESIAVGNKNIFIAKSPNKSSENVVLKFLKVKDKEVDNWVKHFRNFKCNISHPNIIEYIDLCEIEDTEYNLVLVMEYANNGTLIDYLKSHENKLSFVIHCFKQFLAGLSYLHDNGILHRDIKLTNILININSKSQPEVKLGDIEFYGTYFGEIRTTPEFLAPEVTNYSDYDIRSEIWAIGVMMYELFTGHYPFGSRLNGDTIERIAENAKTKIPPMFDKIPFPFREISKKSLVKDPNFRIQSIKVIIEMLSMNRILFSLLKSKLYAIMNKNNKLLILWLSITIGACTPQKKEELSDCKNCKEVIPSQTQGVLHPDNYAQYPNGIEGLSIELTKNISREELLKTSSENYRIVLSFTVTSEGKIKSEKILKGVSDPINLQILSSLKMTSNWVPAHKDGKPIDIEYILPIRFEL